MFSFSSLLQIVWKSVGSDSIVHQTQHSDTEQNPIIIIHFYTSNYNPIHDGKHENNVVLVCLTPQTQSSLLHQHLYEFVCDTAYSWTQCNNHPRPNTIHTAFAPTHAQ